MHGHGNGAGYCCIIKYVCAAVLGAAASGGKVASQTDELTFMRGLVMTDAKGLAVFETVYPGTYEGRTPHIHAKVYSPGCKIHCFARHPCAAYRDIKGVTAASVFGHGHKCT